MPDWSYRTLIRPALFRFSAKRGRDFALGIMGLLARVPLGPRLIDLLGHMRPPNCLERSVHGVKFASPIGLGIGIDANAVALPALARFGFGFMEVGPVALRPATSFDAIERREQQQALWYPDAAAIDLESLLRRLGQAGQVGVPLVVRIGHASSSEPEEATRECCLLVEQLAGHASVIALAFTGAAVECWISADWRRHLARVVESAQQASAAKPTWICIPPDLDQARANDLVETALACGIAGVLVEGGIRATNSGKLLGAPAREPALSMVRNLRGRFGATLTIVSSGGVHEPEHTLQFFTAGANLVQVDSGLVFGGPGLPKRINEAVSYESPGSMPPALRPAEATWFWTLLLGLSMLLGGLLALAISATRVVLPYDEAFTGLSREQLQAANPRLLSFMAHDRISLAGTMIAIGIIYTLLSLFAARRGQHWARQAILYSAGVGFFTFFLFLGFGYFDPFHAFVTAILMQFLLLGLHSRLPPPVETVAPNLRDDWRWRWSLWGQLLFVLEGFGLLAAGFVISGIGVTRIFVHEDLAFMATTREALAGVSPHLLPLIAHDRASFGGMLIAFGLAVELPALWGYRRGARWLWWALLLANAFAYGAALAVHFAVGYTDWFHLLPAYTAIIVVAFGSWLSYPYLCQTDPGVEEAWKLYRGSLPAS